MEHQKETTVNTSLLVLKLGGDIVDDVDRRRSVLSTLAQSKQRCILVHGGGKVASELSTQLGVLTEMVDGRRITDVETLKIVTMVYAGLINKTLVADAQLCGLSAVGLSGVDANLLLAHKRHVQTVDYGYVGDIDAVNVSFLQHLLEQHHMPVIAPISHDGQGQLLNTNADTVCTEIARAMSVTQNVEVLMLLNKEGVLRNADDDASCITELSEEEFVHLREEGSVHSGMLAKLENAFALHRAGIHVRLCSWRSLSGGTVLI